MDKTAVGAHNMEFLQRVCFLGTARILRKKNAQLVLMHEN